MLTGGVVWTGRADRPFAEAVAIRDGRVAAVGSAAEVRAAPGGAREVVELAGKAVLPGFQDAHCHPTSGGMQMRRCDMGEARTLGDCQAAVRDFLERHPRAKWVTGKGWSMETFPGGTPDTSGLDAVCGGRPAFVVNRDGHSAWVSSRALELAGIDASTLDPAHGRIERDELGRPLGTLHEGAMDLVSCLVPPVGQQELTIPFIGETRASWQYPFASLADGGAVLAGGSDWPVSTANPLEEIAVAVARALPVSARHELPAEPAFLPPERLGLVGALGAFTAGSAYVNHLERETGTIEEGKLADLVALAEDPFSLDTEDLPEARVLLTMVAGEVVFDAGRA